MDFSKKGLTHTHTHHSNPTQYYSNRVDLIEIEEETVNLVGHKGGRATKIVQETKKLDVLEADAAVNDHRRVQ